MRQRILTAIIVAVLATTTVWPTASADARSHGGPKAAMSKKGKGKGKKGKRGKKSRGDRDDRSSRPADAPPGQTPSGAAGGAAQDTPEPEEPAEETPAPVQPGEDTSDDSEQPASDGSKTPPLQPTPPASEQPDGELPDSSGAPPAQEVRPPAQTAPPISPVPPPAQPTAASDDVLLHSDFSGSDGLVTNHYAYWSKDPTALQDVDWAVEGGSLFRKEGTAWTGVPDNVYRHDRASSDGTGSQIFRAWTKQRFSSSVEVSFDLKNNGYTSGSADRPAKSWDGVKIWLHHRYDSEGYALEVNRRQGNVIIQKKSGGDYFILANTSWDGNGEPARFGEWEKVGAVARNNPDGSVTLQVIRDGKVVLTYVDKGAKGGPPLRDGDVGIRGDNTDFQFDNVTIRSA